MHAFDDECRLLKENRRFSFRIVLVFFLSMSLASHLMYVLFIGFGQCVVVVFWSVPWPCWLCDDKPCSVWSQILTLYALGMMSNSVRELRVCYCYQSLSYSWLILCLIPRTTVTSLIASKNTRCKTHPLCVNLGVPFWTRKKTHKLHTRWQASSSGTRADVTVVLEVRQSIERRLKHNGK